MRLGKSRSTTIFPSRVPFSLWKTWIFRKFDLPIFPDVIWVLSIGWWSETYYFYLNTAFRLCLYFFFTYVLKASLVICRCLFSVFSLTREKHLPKQRLLDGLRYKFLEPDSARSSFSLIARGCLFSFFFSSPNKYLPSLGAAKDEILVQKPVRLLTVILKGSCCHKSIGFFDPM